MRRLLGVIALLLLPLTACTGRDAETDDPPSAQDVAVELAAALAAGDVSGLAFTEGTADQAQASYAAILGELADLDPTVRVEDVVEQSGATDRVTATLAWTWPIGPEAWSYESSVPLVRVAQQWQVTWSSSAVEPDLVAGDTLALDQVSGPRGNILGGDGAPLVTERPVRRFGLDKPQLAAPQVRSAARSLARLVGVDVASYVAQVRASGPQAFVEAIVYREGQVPPDVEAAFPAIPGARAVADLQPLAPTREFAAPILGRVGPVTAEMVEADPDAYRAGDVAGLSGLQARYDDTLRAQPTQIVRVVPAEGQDGTTGELFRSASAPGQDLALTLDERLQTQAEQALADVGPASALVAIRPSTGDVLAVANGPGNGGQNLATFGQYAPGSTFKIVSSLALLRAGLSAGSTVPCTPTVSVDGRVFGNYGDYPASGLGDIALRTAVANSCNTAFISQAGRLDDQGADLTEAAHALGLGIDHDLGFPAYFGQVDPPASLTEAAADLIGQGTVLASPLTMAAVIASVQQGSTVVPRLVTAPAPPADAQPPPAPLTGPEAETLRGMLRGVVTGGSGALLADVPGAPVIAKTGTAEFGTAADGGDLPTHAWMVAAQGDLAVAVFVDIGAGGSSTAGPILETFLRAAG